MSTMLNFKYGSFSKLPKDKSAGTIYVTTDEKAMYVDLPNSENEIQRIRLSQIITLNTSDWQNLRPPYSTEAFYYVSDANALLKYDGEGQRWVQLNSTADLENSLRALGFLGILDDFPDTGEKGQICIVGGQNYIYNPEVTGDFKWVALSNVGGKILDIEANIASLDGRLSDVEDDISALELRVEAAEADIDILELVTGYKGKVDAVPTEAGNTGDVYLVEDKFYVYVPAINNDAAHWAEVGNESARIENLKKRVEEVALAAGDKTAIEDLTKDLAALDAAIKAMDGANLHSFADVEKALGEAGNTYATKTELVDAKTAILGEKNYNKTVKDAYTLAERGVQDAAEAKTLAETKVTMTDVEAKNYITMADVEGKKYATKIEAQEYANDAAAAIQGDTTETVESVDAKAAKNQGDIAALQSSVDSLSDTIEQKIQAADAMVYMGTVSSKDELPTSQVSIGATYKAIAEFDLDDDTHVYIGDLLIARGAEDDSLTTEAGAANENFGFITAETLTWDHVSSGYRADYVPSLAVTEETAEDNRVKVNLTSAHAGTSVGDLGNIIIAAADNSAVTVSAINTANKSGTIAIGMAWGTFE